MSNPLLRTIDSARSVILVAGVWNHTVDLWGDASRNMELVRVNAVMEFRLFQTGGVWFTRSVLRVSGSPPTSHEWVMFFFEIQWFTRAAASLVHARRKRGL
jgi:hypothetical protein